MCCQRNFFTLNSWRYSLIFQRFYLFTLSLRSAIYLEQGFFLFVCLVLVFMFDSPHHSFPPARRVGNHVCAMWSWPWLTEGGLFLRFWNEETGILFSWVMVLKVGASVATGLEQVLFYQVHRGAEKAGAWREKWSRCAESKKRKQSKREWKSGRSCLGSLVSCQLHSSWF